MDMKEMMKFQFMSQMGNQQQHASSKDGKIDVWPMLLQFLMMTCMGLFDELLKQVPKLIAEAKMRWFDHFRNKVERAIEPRPKMVSDTAVPLSKRHFLNSFTMMRTYCVGSKSSSQSPGSEDSNNMVDSVLTQISKLNNVPSFQLIENAHIMINYKETPIQMTKDIFVKIEDVLYAEGKLSSVKLCLLSNTISAAEITNYVRSLYDAYLETMKNSLGSNIYFFDQKNKDGSPPAQLPVPGANPTESTANFKRMKISTAPKQLAFTMTPFQSNKQFSNIYGKEIREIEQRIRFFMDNKDWYDSKGIPYQLGLLLSGIAGCGKTSCIRAIANLTKRHIINVNFANITTATQLKNLFYSEKLQTYTDSSLSNTHSYFIPVEQRLYVLEEIDAVGDIVKQRTAELSNTPTVNDELNLMEILTVLDGTMEVPGRIVIMTTNHPEVLDTALIRPGRMDLKVKFTNSGRDLIAEMYEAYLEKPLSKTKIEELPDQKLSPAEVGQVLFRHFGTDHTEDDIVQDFIKTAEEKTPFIDKTTEESEQQFEEEEMVEQPEPKKKFKQPKMSSTPLEPETMKFEPDLSGISIPKPTEKYDIPPNIIPGVDSKFIDSEFSYPILDTGPIVDLGYAVNWNNIPKEKPQIGTPNSTGKWEKDVLVEANDPKGYFSSFAEV